MSQGYITTLALYYTFHFYKMYENISVSHERDSFNEPLRSYMFYSAEVGSSVKNQVLAVL